MKKRFTFLIAALMLLVFMMPSMVGWGQTVVTFTPGTDVGETTVTKSDITATMTTMNNSNYYQIYANQSGTFSTASGNITKIEFTCTASGTSKYGPGNASSNVGNYSYSGNTGTWTGSATSITISSTAQVRMTLLTITYTPATPAYTITAQSNNISYGTVSLSGSVITGSPKSGYRYASPAYSVSPANSATVSQEGNAFTVTPSANTTVTINFEAIPTHTATFSVNGNTSQTASVAEGAAITFPSNISPVYGKPFMGWVSAAIDGTTDEEPEFVTSATMGENDITYYAVFATVEEGEPQETKIQTMQYDTWSYSGNTTDKSSYRLFGANSYIVSSNTFDLSKLSTVKVYGGTFGGATYCNLTIGDGSNTWKNGSLSGNGNAAEHTFTDGTTLSGTGYLRVTSNSGNGSNTGLRISKVEIYISEPTYTYSDYCTTVTPPAVAQPVITVDNNPFLFSTTATIACETEGAIIKFSYDNETWNNYSSALTITATTTVYAKAIKDANESTVASITITKNLAAPTVTIDASGITNKNVYSGTAAGSLSATVTYNEVAIGGASVTWEGDDDDVATITSAGVVTLVAAGSVTFTATYAGNTDYKSKTATYTMVVINVDPSAPSYTLVTSTSQIIPGAHYVLSSSKTKDATAYIMDEQSGTYRLTETATILEDNEDGRIYIQKSSLYEFVISGFTDNYTIYDETNGTPGYLYHTSDKSVGVTNTLSNSGKWKITFDNDKAIINNFGSQSYYLEFNTSANPKRVTDYAGTQPDGYLYIKDSDPDIHPYSSSEYTSGSVTINDDIILSENYNITVGAGATLRFTKAPTCSNASWLVIEEGGQLIIPAAKADPVKATFQREVEGYGSSTDKDKYILLANPTTGDINPTGVDGMLDNNYDLYYFDEAQTGAEWRNYKKVTFNLVNGKGYLYANSENTTLNLEGTVPTATSKTGIELSYTEDNPFKGFNLIGNPFSVNITSMQINSIDCPYYKLNNDGTFASIPANNVSSNPVIVGEAFMVQTASGDYTLDLNTAKKDANSFNDEVIRIEVSNSKYTDVAYICYGNSMPLTKINHLNDDAPMIYIHTESDDRAIAVLNERSEVKSVNVNFEAKTIGSYTISAKAENGNFSYMHLYDRLTGVDTDMLENDYTFIGAKEDAAGRFILSFEAVDNNSENDIFAYQNGNDIIINGEGELQIFDVMGRMVSTQRVNGREVVTVSSQGVYILRLIGAEIKTQKIVVR